MIISIEKGEGTHDGNSYRGLGIAYFLLVEFSKTFEYHEKNLKTAIEIGDWAGEGQAYGNLGNDYFSLDDFRKAIKLL